MANTTIEKCFIEIKNGANIKQGVIDGGYPITRIESLSNNKFNRDRMGYAGITDLEKYYDYILNDGDLLMSHINSVQFLGRSIVYKKNGDEAIIHGMNLLRLKPNFDLINPHYINLYFYGKKFRTELARVTKKSVNQASFSVTDLKKISILLPTIDIQKAIAEKMESIHKVIEVKKRLLSEYDHLIKSRFVEMFGDPILNQKGWNLEKLQSVCPVNKYKGEVENISGKVWLLNLDMIESNTGKIIDYVYEDENKIASSTIKFDTNCVLYSKLRPYLNKVVVPSKSGYATSEMISMKTDNINNYFLSNLLMMNSFVDFANGTSYGAKMPRASVDMIKNFDLMLPPKSLQDDFGLFVEQVDKLKFGVQKSLDETQKLFDSLMQEYFG
ncbi:MAG: restriction endonuclease subunit S [Paracholeplasma sp.]|nr:restriction endonuclease subunit S [Paracholeplasma sp.]MDY3195307.1 restriction endonuclease subunit S [Paracholeplasma sp.]